MKIVNIESIVSSFGNDIPKIIDYIKDSSIEVIDVNGNLIPSDNFCNNINEYYEITR